MLASMTVNYFASLRALANALWVVSTMTGNCLYPGDLGGNAHRDTR